MVVVVPLTVRLPVTVTFCANVASLLVKLVILLSTTEVLVTSAQVLLEVLIASL